MPFASPHSLVSPYVTNLDGNVFALKNLPEEVVSFLFARYSRSPLSLRDDLANMLTDEATEGLIAPATASVTSNLTNKAAAFADKWIVGYGHSSVSEHSVLHLAIENVSMIVSKMIEDARLASYTEKSTRYVAFDENSVVVPTSFEVSGHAVYYRTAVAHLMQAYTGWLDEFVARIKEQAPKKPKQTDKGYETSCRATAFDSLRYLLPSGTTTNIGLTINARSLAHLIRKLRSSGLAEAVSVADQLQTEGSKIVPTLLKHTEAVPYLAELAAWREQSLWGGEGAFRDFPRANTARIVWPCIDHVDNVEDALMHGFPYPPTSLDSFLEKLLGGRGKHDAAPRELERISVTFALTMDFGAYRDIQRHRMATQVVGPVSLKYGYSVPRGIEEFGFLDRYEALMEEVAAIYKVLHAVSPTEAQYVLPMAHRVPVYFTANLRELFHLIELRTGRQGHYSYREIAQQMYTELSKVYPYLTKYIRVDLADYALTRDEK